MTEEAKTGALPPQVLLARVIQERTMALGSELAGYVKNETGLNLGPNFVSFTLDSPQFPVHIEGADALKPEFLRYEPNEGWAMIAVTLFNDKSPYMKEQDIDEFGDIRNIYEIVCLPEVPPFLVHEDRLGGRQQFPDVRAYLRAAQEGTQPSPYYLNHDEAQRLIAILKDPILAACVDKEEGLMSGVDTIS